ncbi:hypothetical protein CHUAL_013912 [Chamberlinius hualienensis]
MMKTDGNHVGENGSSGGSVVKFELISHPCSDVVTYSGESYSNHESECADQRSDDKSGQTDVDMSEEGKGNSPVAVNLSASHQNRDPPVFSSSFTSSNNLEVFKCVQCPYETYNLATLASHQKIHKLYQCDICQMKFSHAANMRRHRMRHTGFKPFECRVCLKRFFRKDHLMEHMITHSKQLPFQCPLCDKSFTRQVYFKAHLQTEHWNMPGDKICTICGHKAATIKGAKLHYTTRHAKAANTVNSSSPVNSRVIAEDIAPSVVTRSSLMSARLQTGPTLVTTEHHRSPSASDSESFPSLNLAPLDGCVTSSQLVYTPPVSTGGLMSDTMNSLISPLSVNSSGNEMNDLGDNSSNLIYPFQMAPKLSIRSHLLSPPPNRSLRNPPSPSITLHRIDNGRYIHRDRKQKRPVQSCNGVAAAAISSVKMEPQDDVNNNSSSSGSDDENEDINQSYLNTEVNSSRNHSNTCSPNSTLDLVKIKQMDGSGGSASSAGGSAEGGIGQAVIHQRHISTVGDLTITPLDTILVCVHCGIVFPDQTLYFLHKGVHSENNPWKCNICGELCRDKYDFNTHILSKAHQ